MCDYWDTQLPENLSTDTLLQSAGELYQDYKQLTRALLDLTPGGSEYHDSPQRCLDWIKDRMAMTGKIARERNELRVQRDDLLAACEALANATSDVLDAHAWPNCHDCREATGALEATRAAIARARGNEDGLFKALYQFGVETEE